jgi:hypothetical protein
MTDKTLASQASVTSSDEATSSILTPFAATLGISPASKSEADNAQTIQPPLVTSQGEDAANSTRQPSASITPIVLEPAPEVDSELPSASAASTRPFIVDRSFQYAEIDGRNSSEPVVVNNFSHLDKDISCSHDVESSAFVGSIITGATANNHSFNGNVNSFTNSGTAGSARNVNYYYNYSDYQ